MLCGNCLDLLDVAPAVLAACLFVDCAVHLNILRKKCCSSHLCKVLDQLCRFCNIEHVDDCIDSALLCLFDEGCNRLDRCKAGDHCCIAAGVGDHTGLKVAGVQGLQICNNEAVRADLADLTNHM